MVTVVVVRVTLVVVIVTLVVVVQMDALGLTTRRRVHDAVREVVDLHFFRARAVGAPVLGVEREVLELGEELGLICRERDVLHRVVREQPVAVPATRGVST